MNCKTDGAVYEIEVYKDKVICRVLFPAEFSRDETKVFKISISRLKQRIHDGMEEALAPLFPQYPEKERP